MASMTHRQPIHSTSSRRGIPADTAPATPHKSAAPVTRENRSGGNQWIASFMRATQATATDPPMRSLPRLARAR